MVTRLKRIITFFPQLGNKLLDGLPLMAVELFNPEEDRRHARRALDQDEFRYLIQAAKSGSVVEGISGEDRHMFYILAAWTGFRKGELGSVTLRHFRLDGDYPTLRIAASYSKRRREDSQFLHPDVVSIFKTWVEKKNPGPNEILFPVSEKTCGLERKTSAMVETDLTSAREVWIAFFWTAASLGRSRFLVSNLNNL